MKQADKFSRYVSCLEHAIRNPNAPEGAIVDECAYLIASLYSQGLALRSVTPDNANFEEPECISGEELEQVISYASRLPFQYYNDAIDPLDLERQECGLGDISDDLCDIYIDVVSANRLFLKGNKSSAIWHWKFTMRTHWGRHATSAMHALECFSHAL